jgi:predicted nucleic acid-binding protein
MICDSNILIYAADPGDTLCLPYAQRADAMIASVTRIEVLGFPQFEQLPPERQTALHAVVASTTELPLDEDIIRRAIRLRQQKRMKLGDAIIAATALEYSVPLVTRNEGDFRHIDGLDILNPFEAGMI